MSLLSYTLGNNDSFTFGTTSKVTAGLSNSLNLGAQNTLTVGTTTAATIAGAVSATLGRSVTLGYADTLSFGSGKSLAIKEKFSTNAKSSVVLTAGCPAGEQTASWAKAETAMTRIKQTLVALAVANTAIGATAAALSSDASKSLSAFDNNKKQLNTALGTSIAGIGANTVAMIAIMGLMDEIASALDQVKGPSALQLSLDNASLTRNDPGAAIDNCTVSESKTGLMMARTYQAATASGVTSSVLQLGQAEAHFGFFRAKTGSGDSFKSSGSAGMRVTDQSIMLSTTSTPRSFSVASPPESNFPADNGPSVKLDNRLTASPEISMALGNAAKQNTVTFNKNTFRAVVSTPKTQGQLVVGTDNVGMQFVGAAGARALVVDSQSVQVNAPGTKLAVKETGFELSSPMIKLG